MGSWAVRVATPDSKKQGGVDSMELFDAVLGTDESLAVWEEVLAIVGWAAGSRLVHEDGKWVHKGPNVPDQLPRARRLAALRTRTLLRQEFGDTETARTVLTRLADLLALLDADTVEEEAAAEQQPTARKWAPRKPLLGEDQD